MHIKVMSKWLVYQLDIKGKYSVIQGDSGNGKTNLCRLLLESEFGERSIKVQCERPVIALERRFRGNELSGIEDSVIVIDENCMILKQPDLARILRESNNYFIIISRDRLDFLPLNIENIYDMKTTGKLHWIEQRYHVSGDKRFFRVEHIVTEDSASGLDFLKHHYNVDVQSAQSKSQITSYLSNKYRQEPEYDNVLVVYDAASFAYNKDLLDDWISSVPIRVMILDWYSFEHYVLTQNPFRIFLTQEDIGCQWESLEQAAEAKLSDCIQYAKGHLASCLKKESSCNNCRNVSACLYKHTSFKPDLYIEPVKVKRMEVF